MRISDWSSDVCSSDLIALRRKRVTEMIPGTSATTPPQRRPVILHVSFDEAGAAIGRLIAIAMPPTRAAETGASWKVADFLLAWWHDDECGHFPLLPLSNVVAVFAGGMLTTLTT